MNESDNYLGEDADTQNRSKDSHYELWVFVFGTLFCVLVIFEQRRNWTSRGWFKWNERLEITTDWIAVFQKRSLPRQYFSAEVSVTVHWTFFLVWLSESEYLCLLNKMNLKIDTFKNRQKHNTRSPQSRSWEIKQHLRLGDVYYYW